MCLHIPILQQTVTVTATAQISQYLSQVKEFTDSSVLSITSSLNNKLTALSTAADAVCDEMKTDCDRCQHEQTEVSKLCSHLDSEIAALNKDVGTLMAQYAKEEQDVKNELLKMKKSSFEMVKKTIATRYSENASSSGTGGKKMQLLKALREI